MRAGNEGFVLDCYEALLKAAATSKINDPKQKDRCAYHVHEDGKKCK